MKKTMFQRVLCLVLSVTTLFAVLSFSVSAGELKGDESTSSTLEQMKALVSTTSYDEYLAEYPGKNPAGLSVFPIRVTDVTGDAILSSESKECTDSFDEDQSKWSQFGDNWDSSVYLPATGSATWQFTLSEAQKGKYLIKIEYYNCTTSESSISTIERKLYIDNSVPFSEASYISLPKTWVYDNISTVTGPAAAGDKEGSTVVYEVLDREERDADGKLLREKGYYKVETIVKNGEKTVITTRISQDINGNSMAPNAVQHSKWSTYYVQDSTGYYQDYFQFYILNGTHTITLEAEREPVIIRSIELVPASDEFSTAATPDYATVKQEYAANGYKAPANGQIHVLEAEFPDAVSDSSVYATNDNTSSATYPITSKAQLYNVIGENSYSSAGQWAAYEFTVNETGLYKLSMRFKQDALQGMYICRTIKLAGGRYGLSDGTPTVPFREAYNTQFNYSKDWQSSFLQDGEGNVFEFYFEAGERYTLYLECSLGSLREPLQRVEAVLNTINDCYLRILQLTGTDPDKYNTSYNFLGVMPEVLIAFLDEAVELENIKAEFEALCGTSGSHIATLDMIAILLDKMGSDDGDNIAANMGNLKSYLGTLGTWINSSKQSAMMVDSISICPADKNELKRANANFFQSAWFEIKSFFHSFFTQYDQMGLTTVPDENTTTIDVWLATGRDQSNIWRTMIDAQDGFTESTGVAVTLKLVTGGTLLPSILSGKGPDVYIGLGASDVINYAIRDAVLGVSGNYQYDDATESAEHNQWFTTNYYTYRDAEGNYTVTSEYKGEEGLTNVSKTFDETIAMADGTAVFAPAAMDTVRLMDVTYGIPNTMSMSMMFYRMDVLAKLGEEVPESWSELLALLPVLQTNNMSIGLAYGSAIDFMIYQRGGSMWQYTDDPLYAGSRIALGSTIALEAFEYVCRLYSDYSFPVSYDAANRFRTGEMPIIIGDYASIYNQLVVYATEIDGMWEFCSLPGTVREDGSFNFDSLAGVSATVMLHGCSNVLAAWQFIQWQTSASVQGTYGNKMVALIGPSAKYESANLQAIRNLSWTASERRAIETQMQHLSSVVNYPGSYIIGRYTNFAFLAAVNDGENPIDAISGYIDTINQEIKRKRDEFNLPTKTVDEWSDSENG